MPCFPNALRFVELSSGDDEERRVRVATYTESTAVTRSSIAGLLLLVVTILLGSTAVLQLVQQLAPALSSAVTLMWLSAYSAAFVGLMVGHGINWIFWLTRYRILLVVLMFGTMASIAWAYDTQLSIERTVHLVGSTLIAFYIGFTVPLLNTLRTLAVVLGVLFLASVAAALFMPALGLEPYEGRQVWRGILNSKNALGFWSAVGVLLYLTLSDSVRTASMRMLCYLMAAVSLVLLVFSQSATSLLVMIVAGGVSLYLFIAARFRLGFIAMMMLAILMVGLIVLIGSNINSAELVGRSDDLTGRGEVWRQTWQLIMQRPMTGFGYGVLWFPSEETSWIQESLTDFTWTVHHAHNGFLQVASEIGLPLAVVALLWVVQQLIEILYCQYQRQQVGVLFVLAFAISYLLSNFSEARFLVNRELFWILFIALPISMLRQINIQAPISASHGPGVLPGSATAVPVAGVPAVGLQAGGMSAATTSAATSPAPATLSAEDHSAQDTAPPAASAANHTDTDAAYAQLDQQPERDASQWSEEDFDSTISTLTIADADIDLGEPTGLFGSTDGLPDGPLRAPMNQVHDVSTGTDWSSPLKGDNVAAEPLAPAFTDDFDMLEDKGEQLMKALDFADPDSSDPDMPDEIAERYKRRGIGGS